MNLKHLFNADSALSVMLHAFKAAVALCLNWVVLHHFAVSDFVVWTVTSSILVVATASDLGIGQYVVTGLINSDRREWPRHVGQALGAIAPLALISAIFVFVEVEGPTPEYRLAMAMLLAGRILTIPFVAVLNAVNQFKVRKAVEFVAYLVALAAVAAIVFTHSGVHLALFSLNVTFLAGALVTVAVAGRYVPLRRALMSMSPVHSAAVFRAATPYMANNITGLLTYGGFVWLSSLVLPRSQVAMLAVLHTFVLMNLYQIYDVFLKARQADLSDPARLQPYIRLNWMIMIALPPAFLVAGPKALALIAGKRIEMTTVEAGLYGLFAAFELGNLFAQSITQVNLAMVSRLKSYSAVRAIMIGGFLAAGLLPLRGDEALLVLLGVLLVGSSITFGYLFRKSPWIPVAPAMSPSGLK